MKPGAKRRRSKAQIKEEKAIEDQRKLDIQAKLLAWPQLEKQLHDAQQKVQWAEGVHDGLEQMQDSGVIEQQDDGRFVAVADPVRQEQNASKRKLVRQHVNSPNK